MLKGKDWKLVQYQGRLESYFPDSSIISSNKNGLTYYSTKGNKVIIGKETLRHSQEIADKLKKIAVRLTAIQDAFYTPIKDSEGSVYNNSFYKKYKIQEFRWETSHVRESQLGFEIKSDDGTAEVVLQRDLYRVRVRYPQRTGGRKVTEDQLFLNKKNRRKELIEKYGGKYVEYPQSMVNVEIQHQYLLVQKQLTILTLPSRWCPPLRAIWGYILSNEIIPHPFCYIDFEDPDNRTLRDIQSTKMPPVISLLPDEENLAFQQQSIPLYGKPNHNYKWKWLWVQNESFCLTAYYVQGRGCFVCEDYGFWSIEGQNAYFKTHNKEKDDYKVSLSAFPITVRLDNQPARDIRMHILAASNYRNHRQFVNSKPKEQQSIINSQNQQVICQEQIPAVGVFKAYANKVVVARFMDRTLVTIRQSEVRIIGLNGRSLGTSLNGVWPKQFRQHMDWLAEWYDKVFNHQEWLHRQEMKTQIQSHIQSTQAFLAVADYFKRQV